MGTHYCDFTTGQLYTAPPVAPQSSIPPIDALNDIERDIIIYLRDHRIVSPKVAKSVSEIAYRSGVYCHRSTVSRWLARMNEKGMVVVYEDGYTRRYTLAPDIVRMM